jgi:hypothetical protein
MYFFMMLLAGESMRLQGIDAGVRMRREERGCLMGGVGLPR